MKPQIVVTGELVTRVAGLANLELSDAEVAYYEGQLSRILDYIAQLDTLPDTLAAGWRSDTQGPATPERPDHAQQEDLPVRGAEIRVPRILE